MNGDGSQDHPLDRKDAQDRTRAAHELRDDEPQGADEGEGTP